MAPESTDLRLHADFAADAVMHGLLPPARVVAWADAMIESGGLPPPWLVDLSLVNTSDVLAIRSALAAVPGKENPAAKARLLNALVLREWRAARLTIGQVRGVGWQLYLRNSERYDLAVWGAQVDHDGDALDDGLITEQQMREAIDSALASFDASINELPIWA